MRVLFVGNSLTASNDVPGMVQALATAGGVPVQVHSTSSGGSLEDQWAAGEQGLLGEARWDFVVLQQGPSTRPESQSNLKEWAARWADEARRHGATPVLYMVWPFQHQGDAGFALASGSYRAAAEAAKARVLPAGDAWREALRRDPGLPLYSADKLHPTEAGSYLAALVIAHGLTGVRPETAPARLILRSGRVVEVPEDRVQALRQAAGAVIGPPDR
jgi:hypothetical protein